MRGICAGWLQMFLVVVHTLRGGPGHNARRTWALSVAFLYRTQSLSLSDDLEETKIAHSPSFSLYWGPPGGGVEYISASFTVSSRGFALTGNMHMLRPS